MNGPLMDGSEFPTVMRTLDARYLTDMFPNMAGELASLMKDDSKEHDKSDQKKNYAVKKRAPVKPLEGDNVIFVNRKTNFKAQLVKCTELLAKNEKEIILHGLGAAIQRCCNLALQLHLTYAATHEIEINTSTIDLIDDLVPLMEELDFDTQYRYQSSVHIRIFKTAMDGASK